MLYKNRYHPYRNLFWPASIVVWILFAMMIGLSSYVNYYLPHGPSFDTGRTVCENADMGPCGELYAEDMRGLHITEWEKFLRENSFLLLFSLMWLGTYLTLKASSEENFLQYNPNYCTPETFSKSVANLKKESDKLFTQAESLKYKNPERAEELLAKAKNALRIAEQASVQIK